MSSFHLCGVSAIDFPFVIQQNEVIQTNGNHSFSNIPIAFSTHRLSPPDCSSEIATSDRSEHAPYEIYYNYLWIQQRGTPLWEPGPPMTLPTNYRSKGISIGDVGIIDLITGAFIFLFNIFLPADHEINRGRAPSGFAPLNNKVEQSIRKRNVSNRWLASSSLRRTDSSSVLNLNMLNKEKLIRSCSDFAFQTTDKEGAVLVMPDGALAEDLGNCRPVEKYIAANAKSWWEHFQSDDCFVQIEHSIQVVVGVDKVSSWGMATFENVEGPPIQFEFKDEGPGFQGRTYKWRGINSCNKGPSEDEMWDLLPGRNASPIRNQCVFVRMLNVSVPRKARDKLAVQVCSSCLGDCTSDSSQPAASEQQYVNIQSWTAGLPVSSYYRYFH
jgi:hypothetical protein